MPANRPCHTGAVGPSSAIDDADSSPIEGVWLGGDLRITSQPHEALERLRCLERRGVTVIVDVRAEGNDEEWVRRHNPTIEYHHMGVADDDASPPDSWFDHGTDLLRSRLEAGRVILVHCHFGINRAPSMCVGLLLSLGWRIDLAMARIRESRPIANAAYAEDALAWWHARSETPSTVADADQLILSQWRQANPLDGPELIDSIRRQRSQDRKLRH